MSPIRSRITFENPRTENGQVVVALFLALSRLLMEPEQAGTGSVRVSRQHRGSYWISSQEEQGRHVFVGFDARCSYRDHVWHLIRPG